VKLLEIDGVTECRIVSRINRFVVEVKVNKVKKRANINNTGRLKELLIKGRKGYCIRKGIKTEYRLFGIKSGRYATIIDTQLQMRCFEIALKKNLIPWLNGYNVLKRNVKINNSRIDYLLKRDEESIFLEIKSAALRKNKYAMYPDCPSSRGRRHITELIKCANDGQKAVILFVAAVPKVKAFKPNKRADKQIFNLLKKAMSAGVLLKAISIYYDPTNCSIILNDPDLKVINI